MTWFDVVKKVKMEGDVVKKIFQEIIDRDKRVMINEEIAFELIDRYRDILTERAKTKLYNDEGKNITRMKSALTVRFKRDPRSLIVKIHGYVRNLYPRIKTSGMMMYFIDENEKKKYILENPQRMTESSIRRRAREGR